jgi:hypothetical protein
VDAARFGAILRVLPAFTDAPKLKGCERKHDPQDKLTRRCGRIELTVSGQHNAVHLLDALDSLEPTNQRAGEPVDPSDDDTAGLAALNPRKHLLEGGPIHLPTGTVEVGEHPSDLKTTRLRKRSALFLL